MTYTVIRDDGTMVEVIDEALSGTTATDTAVPAGMPSYQVAAVVNGGEATRSGPVTVTAPNQKPTFLSTEDGMRSVAENTPSEGEHRPAGLGHRSREQPADLQSGRHGRWTRTAFTIDTSNGQLRTKEAATYDHETKDTYEVDRVRSMTGRPLTTLKTP